MASKPLVVGGILILMMLLLVPAPIDTLQVETHTSREAQGRQVLASDITVTGDDDWTLQGWPGNGTCDLPFVIEGISVNNVHLSNTTRWFVIRHSTVECLVHLKNVTNGRIENSIITEVNITQSANISLRNDEYTSYSYLGRIILESSTGIEIANNTIAGSHYLYYEGIGISIRSSRDVRIFDNWIVDHYIGIRISNSSECLIEENEVTSCGVSIPVSITVTQAIALRSGMEFFQSESGFRDKDGEALNLENCTGLDIRKNKIEGNHGASLVAIHCDDIIIYHNEIAWNGRRMSLQKCTYFNMTANSCADGIAIDSSLLGVIVDNTLQTLGLSIQGSLGFLLHTVTNNTLDACPIIYLANANSCILAPGTASQVILVNCTDALVRDVVMQGLYGIEVFFSTNCRLENVTNGRVAFKDCYDTFLRNSRTWALYEYGIIIDSSLRCGVEGNNLTSQNIIVKNQSHEISISNNILRYSSARAISIDSSSSDVLIDSNDIRSGGSSHQGCIDVRGNNCTIINNIVVDNFGLGIALYGTNNRVYYNTIARNGGGNALDFGNESANIWDDNVSRGNAWGDYIGVGCYGIPGAAGSIDRYPSLSLEYIETYVVVVWMLIIGGPLIFIVLPAVRLWKRTHGRLHPQAEHASIGSVRPEQPTEAGITNNLPRL